MLTDIAFIGNCGFRPPSLSAAMFASAPFGDANPFVHEGTSTFAFGTVDPLAPGGLLWGGTLHVPPALNDGTPVTAGLYYVTGACCRDGGGCEGPNILYTPARPFCVSDPENPCDGWPIWLNGGLGAQYFSAGLYLNQIALQFAPPAAPEPAAPLPDVTTTARPRTTQTVPVIVPPTAAPPPDVTTTTALCKNGKPPPCV